MLSEIGCDGFDFVEVRNVSDATVELAGLSVSDRRDDGTRRHVLSGPLAAGASLAVTATAFGIACDEEVFLLDGDTVVDRTTIATARRGATWARLPEPITASSAFAEAFPTPNRRNQPFVVGDVRINELDCQGERMEIVDVASGVREVQNVNVDCDVPVILERDGVILDVVMVDVAVPQALSWSRLPDGVGAFDLGEQTFGEVNSPVTEPELALLEGVVVRTPSAGEIVREIVASALMRGRGVLSRRVELSSAVVDDVTVLGLLTEPTNLRMFQRALPSTSQVRRVTGGADLAPGNTAGIVPVLGVDDLAPINAAAALLVPLRQSPGLMEAARGHFKLNSSIRFLAIAIWLSANDRLIHIDDAQELRLLPFDLNDALSTAPALPVNEAFVDACISDPPCRALLAEELRATTLAIADLALDALIDGTEASMNVIVVDDDRAAVFTALRADLAARPALIEAIALELDP